MSHPYLQDLLDLFNSITPEACRESANFRFLLGVYHKLAFHDNNYHVFCDVTPEILIKAIQKIPVDLNGAELTDDELEKVIKSFSDAVSVIVKVMAADYGLTVEETVKVFDWSAIKVSLN